MFGPPEKEKFRTFMRMYENFSGCRMLAYCLMCNHIHILLEVPPMAEGGISDAELLKRLRAIYSALEVAVVEKQLSETRQAIAEGRAVEELATARRWAAERKSRVPKPVPGWCGRWVRTSAGRRTRSDDLPERTSSAVTKPPPCWSQPSASSGAVARSSCSALSLSWRTARRITSALEIRHFSLKSLSARRVPASRAMLVRVLWLALFMG